MTSQSETRVDSDPFRDGIRAGELRIQRCVSCRNAASYTARVCPSCHSADLSWSTASGRGKLRCFVEVMVSYIPEVPARYMLASVELEEGPHIIARYEAASGRDDGTVELKARFSGGTLSFVPT